MTNVLADIRTAAEAQIEAARFVLSRMANRAVVGLDTGEVLLTTGGVWPIPARCGEVALFRTADDARAEAAYQNKLVAERGSQMKFVAMSFHKAARLQIARAEAIIEMIDGMDA